MRNVEREFQDAFEKYSDELFRHCVLRLSDRERAIELTQEMFLRTWDYVCKGNEVREYRPFLYRTLHHLIIDEYRKHKTQSLEAMVDVEEGETIETLLPTDDTNTLEAAMDRFDGARALSALATLPSPYHETLTLRYIDGFSPKEISEMIGESENVISVRIHRGLKKLRAMLEEKPNLL